jgi:hypothetical protein
MTAPVRNDDPYKSLGLWRWLIALALLIAWLLCLISGMGKKAATATLPADTAPVANTTTTTTDTSSTAMAACSKTFTLGVKDGGTETEKFPFGGEGEGKGYEVTVTRLDVQPRVIGTKQLPLDADCKYGYISDPGTGRVRYDVRPMGADLTTIPLQTVTLTVN